MPTTLITQAKTDDEKSALVKTVEQFDQLCATLADMTERNDHSNSILLLVRSFDATLHLVNEAKEWRDKHEAQGFMSHAQVAERHSVYVRAKSILKNRLPFSQFDQLMRSL